MTEPTDAPEPTMTSTPLITEDLLLLLFDPTSGSIRGEGHTLFHVLAGSVLVDLAAQGHVDIDEKASLSRGREVHAIAGDPPADPVLRTVWDRLVDRSTDVHSLILEIGPTLREPLIDRLVERGEIDEESTRFLGLIPTTKLVDGGTPRRDELVATVRAVLVDDAQPDARSGALGALLSASGVLPMFDKEIPWSGAVYTRGMHLLGGDWGAAAAAEAVARTAAALAATTLFTVILPPSDR